METHIILTLSLMSRARVVNDTGHVLIWTSWSKAIRERHHYRDIILNAEYYVYFTVSIAIAPGF